MEPKAGQIFCWQGDSYFAKLIRRFTDSKWTHVGWFLDAETVLESDWSWWPSRRGVRLTPAYHYLRYPERIAIFDLPISDEERDGAVEYAYSMLGKNYDTRLIFYLAWALWRGKICRGEIRNSNKSYICSELVAKPLWVTARYRFVPECFDLEATTPDDIYRKLSEITNA